MALALVLLGGWEAYGALVSAAWTSQPSLIAAKLAGWLADDLGRHVLVTLSEIVVGLMIGLPLGVAFGLWLGRSAGAAELLGPFLTGLNNLPIVALAPLLIMWFGIGMQPKVALVAFVSFLLLFFNTFRGALAVDEEMIDTLDLMGASRVERLFKVVVPACSTWILAGLRNALPYALIAATIGEMMLSQSGVGFLITNAASQFDMTGLYAGLVVLMILGTIVNEVASHLELWILRWRRVAPR